MRLKLLEPVFAVCKLSPHTQIPEWALSAEVFFLSKTQDELSVICPSAQVPATVEHSADWRCFRVDDDLEFEQTGVVATVSTPIANAGLSLFLVSTHDRDYVLVHQSNLAQAIDVYNQHGFTVKTNG